MGLDMVQLGIMLIALVLGACALVKVMRNQDNG